MKTDRLWMYNRRAGSFSYGVSKFLDFAFANGKEGGLELCPCKKCAVRERRSKDDMWSDLLKNGFMKDYYVWTYHGEVKPTRNSEGVGATKEEDIATHEEAGVAQAQAQANSSVPLPNPRTVTFYVRKNCSGVRGSRLGPLTSPTKAPALSSKISSLEVNVLRAELELVKSQHEQQLELVKSQHAQQLEMLKSQHAQELELVKSQYTQQLESLKFQITQPNDD